MNCKIYQINKNICAWRSIFASIIFLASLIIQFSINTKTNTIQVRQRGDEVLFYYGKSWLPSYSVKKSEYKLDYDNDNDIVGDNNRMIYSKIKKTSTEQDRNNKTKIATIILHGYGDTPYSYIPLAKSIVKKTDAAATTKIRDVFIPRVYRKNAKGRTNKKAFYNFGDVFKNVVLHHGASNSIEESNNLMLDYIDGIISKGYDEIEIIGHSMGAMMALQMAGKRPEIKRIIAQSGALLNTGKEIQKSDARVALFHGTMDMMLHPGWNAGYATKNLKDKVTELVYETGKYGHCRNFALQDQNYCISNAAMDFLNNDHVSIESMHRKYNDFDIISILNKGDTSSIYAKNCSRAVQVHRKIR